MVLWSLEFCFHFFFPFVGLEGEKSLSVDLLRAKPSRSAVRMRSFRCLTPLRVSAFALRTIPAAARLTMAAMSGRAPAARAPVAVRCLSTPGGIDIDGLIPSDKDRQVGRRQEELELEAKGVSDDGTLCKFGVYSRRRTFPCGYFLAASMRLWFVYLSVSCDARVSRPTNRF